MGRNRKKQYKYLQKSKPEDESKVPIRNLPEKYLAMKVKSGSKIKNIMTKAFDEFSNHDSFLWTGVNEGIDKTITCTEIFSRKHPELYNVTNIRFIESANSDNTKRVPEINILFSKNPIVSKTMQMADPKLEISNEELKTPVSSETLPAPDATLINTASTSLGTQESTETDSTPATPNSWKALKRSWKKSGMKSSSKKPNKKKQKM